MPSQQGCIANIRLMFQLIVTRCHSPGDWRVRSVHSEEAGHEGSAPKSSSCDADAVSRAEGYIRATINARLFPGVAGVPSPGHVFTETSREPRRAPCLFAKGVWFTR